MRSPYKHLNRCGYFSGSSNCRRRSTVERISEAERCADGGLTCEDGGFNQLYELVDLH